jgi:MFS family permease
MNLFGGILDAIFLLSFARALHLSAGIIGGILTIGGIGSLAGAVLSERLARRLGIGPLIIVGAVLIGVGIGAIPLAAGPVPLVIAILGAGRIIQGAGNTLYKPGDSELRPGCCAPSTPWALSGKHPFHRGRRAAFWRFGLRRPGGGDRSALHARPRVVRNHDRISLDILLAAALDSPVPTSRSLKPVSG